MRVDMGMIGRMSGARPNIVFIMADQLGARFLGCYGSGVDSTPTLDRLARNGVRFDRFYATSPVCAPNRATILTGRSPEIHGAITNNYALQTDMPTFLHLLQAQGYRTGGFGKFHQTPMGWKPATSLGFLGFDESVVSEDPKWGPWIDWVKEKHPTWYRAAITMTNLGRLGVAPGQGPKWGATPDQIRIKLEEYPRVMEARRKASLFEWMYPSPIPPQVHDTTFITELGLDFLQRAVQGEPGGTKPSLDEQAETASASWRWRRQPGGTTSGLDGQQPFFCYISYVDPHDPYDPPEPYASLYSPGDIPDPIPAEWHEDHAEVFDPVLDCYLGFRRIHDKPDVIKRLRALYHGSLRYLDDQIARIVRFLEEQDLWRNTILVFATDHGDMMGDHELIAKGLPHYDTGIRCPLIVAGGPVTQRTSARLSCSLDLYPTFCDLGGVPPAVRPPIEGKSFAGVFTGEGVTAGDPAAGAAEGWREIAVSYDEADSVITDDGWRLTRYSTSGHGQMFDLAGDPREQSNLYYDPAHDGKRTELLERLVKVRMLLRSVPHYRNMPLDGGWKHYLAGARKPPIPAYRLPTSPWLGEEDRPEWTGS